MKQALNFISAIVIVTCIASCSGKESTGTDRVQNSGLSNTTTDTLPPVNFIPDPTFGGNMEIFSASGPKNITRGVLKASNGLLWFGSWNGLYSYDGISFTNHTLKDGLSHHRVYHVYEDSDGNVWASTAGAGVYRYDGVTFRNYSTRDGLPSNNVFVSFEDKAGNMWFGSDSGATKYDFKDFTHIGISDSLPGSVFAFAESDQGHIWFGTRQATIEYYNGQLTPLTTNEGAMIPSLALLSDQRGRLWIASPNGLYSYFFDTKSSMYILLRAVPNNTTHLALDQAGNILFTCGAEQSNSDGMFVMRYSAERVDTVAQRTGQTGAGGQIFGIAEDATGKVWYGCVQGVCCIEHNRTTELYAK